jgi:adenylate kinase family enzyme
MRIVVIGTSGSGKTTMARRLATALGVPMVEIDAINWQPGWRGLNADDPAELVRRVDAATAGPTWVSDGNYSNLRALLWSRATHLVWLDYPRWVVMRRVIGRSLRRVIDRRELWPGTGNRENWRKWARASHPIRWAWATWRRRRTETEARLQDPRYVHLTAVRLRHPREAASVLRRLADANNKNPALAGRASTRSHLPE